MSYLVIEPSLIELLRHAEQSNVRLVVAGGLGIYLKRRWVVLQIEEHGRKSLFSSFPDARTTEDIDAFLSLQIFERPARATFRAMLRKLGYSPRTNYYQFDKPLDGASEAKVVLDLLAPRGTGPNIKNNKPPRIGPKDNRDSPPDEQLHAHETPEAFAIECGPQELSLTWHDPHGDIHAYKVTVPHPFASLCMKVKAAYDYQFGPAEKRKKDGHKHAFDVYLLTAMLSPDEYEESRNYARQHSNLPEFTQICRATRELFQTPHHPGCVTVMDENDGPRNLIDDALFPRFCDVVCKLFEP